MDLDREGGRGCGTLYLGDFVEPYPGEQRGLVVVLHPTCLCPAPTQGPLQGHLRIHLPWVPEPRGCEHPDSSRGHAGAQGRPHWGQPSIIVSIWLRHVGACGAQGAGGQGGGASS